MAARKIIPASGFFMKDVIDRLGLSLRKTALILNRPETWVRRIANQRHAPSWETAVYISRTLEVPLGVFCDNDPARIHWFQRPLETVPEVPPPAAAAKRAKPRPRKKQSA